MNCDCFIPIMDQGGKPYVAHMKQSVAQNNNFRIGFWTGCYLQMTLMCIPVCGEIGMEIHPDTDQFIRIEQGNAIVVMGNNCRQMNYQQNVMPGDMIFIPAGVWHNVINHGRNVLKVSSIYAPPHHPKGVIQHTKEEADRE